MSDSSPAVFLSYASQDAAAARTICDALRGAGVEVWFDAGGGLEHGDEWDGKIRRRIKECVYFLPVISAHTQARLEGYFRIEWELACERAMGFAPNVPFILPIAIDDTGEAAALVPERFRRVQWTRLPGGAVGPDVLVRFLKLWAERTAAQRGMSVPPLNSKHGQDARATPPPVADDKSIAVLPFANMSADAENEYFSDGITEEIINALVQVPDLRVAARTSVFAFKGKADDLRTIAAKLNVRTVLEGSVRKAGNKIRITAQLINAADGFHLWSEKFDRGLDDIFAVQDEIARTIAGKMKSKLAGETQQALVVASTDNLEAYQLYLQGRYFWAQRGAGLAKGLRCFEAALARDPNFALAHTGVADACSLLAFYGFARGREVLPKALQAARRAIELDDRSAESHCALGFIQLIHLRDATAALASFRRAIALKPTHAPSHYWTAAAVIALQGSPKEVDAMTSIAVRLEPFSIIAQALVGWGRLGVGAAAAAIAPLRHVLELEPRFSVGRWLLGQALVSSGATDEGLAELRRAVEQSNQLGWMVAKLGCALAHAGKVEEARGVLAELTRRAETEYVPSFQFASMHAYLGNEASACAWLERAIEDGDPGLAFLRIDVGPLAPMAIAAAYLRPELRAALVARLGLK